MARVEVTQPHSLSRSDAKAKLTGFTDMMGKYGAKLVWSGDTANIKGIGVSGTVQITDASVIMKLKLGMMAKAAGVDPVRLEGSISKRLKAAYEDE